MTTLLYDYYLASIKDAMKNLEGSWFNNYFVAGWGKK